MHSLHVGIRLPVFLWIYIYFMLLVRLMYEISGLYMHSACPHAIGVCYNTYPIT